MGVRFESEELKELLDRNPDIGIDGAQFRANKPVTKTVKKVSPVEGLDLPRESEETYQNWQIKILQERGWRVHAERPAMTRRTYTGKDGETKTVWVTPVQGDPGFPDVIATHPGVSFCLVIENKSSSGSLSPDQEKWIIAFSRLPGFKVLVSRPEDRAEFLKIVEVKS